MIRTLPLRARLALLTATAVALAIALAATASWLGVRDQLLRQVDESLRGQAARLAHPPPGAPSLLEQLRRDCRADPAGGTEQFPQPEVGIQLVQADGTRCAMPSYPVPVTPADVQVATGRQVMVLRDGTTDTGVHVRVLTTRAGDGLAVSFAKPLTGIDSSLDSLALFLVAVAAIGVLGAAMAGLLIARAALQPVDRLTGAVEHIALTEDLTTPIPVAGNDEIARLGRSFNAMTAALASSRDRQQQLIADTGHELRTPLTSLRTNIDLLIKSEQTGRALPEDQKRTLLANLKAQLQELSGLVTDVLELSRPERPAAQQPREAVALHEIVARAVDRARLRGPSLRIEADLRPWYVHGEAAELERAVVNLLDNAVKFSPPAAGIEVTLYGTGHHGELTVTDHGPGITDADLPHVFERFWRSPAARSLPGSGLGLAIVARVARETGGEISLANGKDGGCVARLRLPGSTAPEER